MGDAVYKQEFAAEEYRESHAIEIARSRMLADYVTQMMQGESVAIWC